MNGMNGKMNRIPPHCSVCTPEQLKLLMSDLATLLAFRFLRPADEQDRDDAFDGLVALCWRAKGNLAIFARVWERLPSIARAAGDWDGDSERLPSIAMATGEWDGDGSDTGGKLRLGRTPYACTREFIEDFVLEYFAPYHGQSEAQILDAALRDKFRYIGHRLKGRMTDEIRRRAALKNQEPVPSRFADVLENDPESVGVFPDYQNYSSSTRSSTLSAATEPRYTNSSTPLDFIRAREPSLTDALGRRSYQVLEAQAEAFPGAFQGTEQAAKSALTRAIARRRAVSEVQARADKRQLLAEVSAEMRRGNRDLNDLHGFLARGDAGGGPSDFGSNGTSSHH